MKDDLTAIGKTVNIINFIEDKMNRLPASPLLKDKIDPYVLKEIEAVIATALKNEYMRGYRMGERKQKPARPNPSPDASDEGGDE